MQKTWWIAAGLAVLLLAWMASGLLTREEPAPPQAPTAREQEAMLVEMRPQEARTVTRELVQQGDAHPARSVVLRARTAGVVQQLHARKGERVPAGKLVAELSLEERSAALREARALLSQQQQAYDAEVSLAREGFVSEQRVRNARAQLEAARAAVERAREALQDTRVTAPFTGIVNSVPVEDGEVVQANGEIATLLDTDPLLVRVDVAQQHIQQIRPGTRAEVNFVTGEEAEGTVSFISVNAEAATRTFMVEIKVPNPQQRIASGISAQVRIPVGEVPAHLLSPALLSLDAEGKVGVMTVADDDTARFHPVEIVRSQPDGIWVAGLPRHARIITRGQGYVRAGEPVRVARQRAEDTDAATGGRDRPEPAAQAAPAAAGG